jgi:hypothetical protein
MAQEGYPPDARIRRSFQWIEQRALQNSCRALFTSPGAIRDYQANYPAIPKERYALIENGYDDEVFDSVAVAKPPQKGGERIVILHSGIIYTLDRDPTHLFSALGMLKRNGSVDVRKVEFRFRASGNDEMLRSLAVREGIEDLITIAPPVPYPEAVREMTHVDGLLLMQASSCNSQIPAKAYEYFRAARPILALTDPIGDTSDLMRRAGVRSVVRIDSIDELLTGIPIFIESLRDGSQNLPDPGFAAGCSRRARTHLLAEQLNSCCDATSQSPS